MERMRFETEDLSGKNIEKIGQLFPNCITEKKDSNGKIQKAINFKMLKQMLSEDVLADGEEAYEFTWVGKKEAMVEANKPIRKTLRPCKEESKDWDTTENLYIEGDNLEVLKLLQESYLNSIKMIYIDPPYNTGSDFIYNDDFKMTNAEYEDVSGEVDAEGNRLFKNAESKGRFHSDWCSMMYSRLLLARNLLSDDGAIFIHIDEHEEYSLSMICNEIFGEKNYLGTLIWDKRNPKGRVAGLAYQHEAVLIYCKEKNEFANVPFTKKKENGEKMLKKVESLIRKYGSVNEKVREEYKTFIEKNKEVFSGGEKAYSLIDDNGDIYRPVSMAAPDKPENRSHRPLIHPVTGKPCAVSAKGWRFKDEKMDEMLKAGRIEFGKDETTIPNQKYFLKDMIEESVSSLLYFGGSDDALGVPFDNPKPVYVAEKLISTLCKGDGIVLDFFSGSATTAHAVLSLNAEDNGVRKFILVQIPEATNKRSKAYKEGYKNICEIGKERIRRAGDKVKAENADNPGIDNLDTGFRVLKLDDTNMKDVYYVPDEYDQTKLFDLESNIKEDRTELDLLYGCLIDWGIPLNRAYKSTNIDGNKVHIYNEGDLVACFAEGISESTVKAIAKMKPLRVVFRDAGFQTSASKINIEEMFKLLSPETSIRVL